MQLEDLSYGKLWRCFKTVNYQTIQRCNNWFLYYNHHYILKCSPACHWLTICLSRLCESLNTHWSATLSHISTISRLNLACNWTSDRSVPACELAPGSRCPWLSNDTHADQVHTQAHTQRNSYRCGSTLDHISTATGWPAGRREVFLRVRAGNHCRRLQILSPTPGFVDFTLDHMPNYSSINMCENDKKDYAYKAPFSVLLTPLGFSILSVSSWFTAVPPLCVLVPHRVGAVSAVEVWNIPLIPLSFLRQTWQGDVEKNHNMGVCEVTQSVWDWQDS